MKSWKDSKPNLGKVVLETTKEISKNFVGSLKESMFLYHLYEFGRHFIPSFTGTITAPYFFPTLYRKIAEKGEWDLQGSQALGAIGGIATGVCINFVELGLYWNNIKEGNLEVLAIPVITNVASAIYERGREVKERLHRENYFRSSKSSDSN